MSRSRDFGAAASSLAAPSSANNGYSHVVDTTQASGWNYAGNQAAGKNKIINGDFNIWQRGTPMAIASTNYGFYGPDRWQLFRAATGSTVSRRATGDTTNLPFIQYCMRVQRDSGNPSTADIQVYSPTESANAIPFAGKNVVLSFYARKGADYSATSSALSVQLITGTGTDQGTYFYTGGASAIAFQSVTLTPTWQRFTVTGTFASNATEFYPNFIFNPTGAALAADYYEITGVQVEVGSVATPFTTATGTLQGELAACQRYYQRLNTPAGFIDLISGWQANTSSAIMQIPLTSAMRVVPSISQNAGMISDTVNYNTAITSMGIMAGSSVENKFVMATANWSGSYGAQFRPCTYRSNSSPAAYIELNSEL